MKQVLLIDDSPIFRDYIKSKLTAKGVTVDIGVGHLDSLSKMRSLVPDLVIIDYNANRNFIFDLLEAKRKDPNAQGVPVIVTAQKIEKEEVSRLSGHSVRKVIPKPIKVDQLLGAVSDILKIEFDIDETPCILEARVNDNILFVEIAQGLNREKIELLRYKMRELIELYNLSSPKVLVMMTDLSLSFVDGPNLDLLLESLTADARVRNKNIKVLTLDGFARDYLEGNKKYADIQVVNDLSKALDSLLRDAAGDASTVISERILSAGAGGGKEASIEMRFKSELEAVIQKDSEALQSVAPGIKIAVVDDDVVIRTVLAKTFSAISARVDQYETGNAFVSQLDARQYDLVFLDLIMPGLNGFEVLIKMREQEYPAPVIVLSAISQREAVLKVLSAGVKSYMIKPLQPDAILKKALEVLKASF